MKIKPVLFILLPFFLVVTFSYFLQGFILANREELVRWLSSFGPYVIMVYILLQFITIIFPPLGGFFLVVAMIALFGPEVALGLAYLVSTPTYLLNFYLARRFGRPLVKKVVGKETLDKVDNYVKDAGTLMLVILRTFQGGYFDYLSYGFGLTKIPFKTFAFVNIFAGIPGIILSYLILSRFDNLTTGIIVFYGVTIILAGIAIYLQRRLKRQT